MTMPDTTISIPVSIVSISKLSEAFAPTTTALGPLGLDLETSAVPETVTTVTIPEIMTTVTVPDLDTATVLDVTVVSGTAINTPSTTIVPELGFISTSASINASTLGNDTNFHREEESGLMVWVLEVRDFVAGEALSSIS